MSAPREQEETAMAREARTDIQKAEKAGVSTVPEQTRPGAVYAPSVDIFENDNSITILADMPGAKAQDLKIDLRESILTLTGRVTAPDTAKESDVLREYQSGTFFRQFTLSETIDQAKIDAKLTDGVLRLELPKVEKARPRQITVRTG
jgi:HSP20 family molecular chaperone IbpA